MGKDVNIKVKTEGKDQVKQDFVEIADSMALMNSSDASRQAAQDQKEFAEYLDQTAESAKGAGEATKEAGTSAESGFDKASSKGSLLDKIIKGVQQSALRMIVAFFGIQQIIGFIQQLSQNLDEVAEKQKKLTERTLTSAEGGQLLETAMGTVGKQRDWAKQIAELQKTGGLASVDQATALMLGMQGATSGVGGIQNPAVAAMMRRLAPRLGASDKSASDLSGIFEAAAKEGVGVEGLESFIGGRLGVTDAQAAAYMKTTLGRSRLGIADQSLRDLKAAPYVQDWQLRMANATAEFERRASKGEDDFWIKDRVEPQVIALESLLSDIEQMEQSTTDPKSKARLSQMKALAKDRIQKARGGVVGPTWAYEDVGRKIQQSMNEMGGINFDYSHNTYQMPIVSPDSFHRGGRVDPNDI